MAGRYKQLKPISREGIASPKALAESVLAKIQESRINTAITKRMQTLLSGLESPYRKISWKFDLSTSESRTEFNDVFDSPFTNEHITQAKSALSQTKLSIYSQPLTEAAVKEVASILARNGITCSYTEDTQEANRWIIKIDSPAQILNPHEIISQHRHLVLNASEFSEETLATKVLMDAITTATEEFSTTSKSFYNTIGITPPILAKLGNAIDEVFPGLKNQKMRTSTEKGMLYPIYFGKIFLSLFSKASPELFQLAFKQTPLGPIFTAAYQIVNEVFFITKWQSGREELLNAQFTTGERCKYFAELYKAAYNLMVNRINVKMLGLKAITGQDDKSIFDYIVNSQGDILAGLSNEARENAQGLINDIQDLSDSITDSKTATEDLIKQLRTKASRLNSKQQVLMATKHFERIFNTLFIGLSIAAFFVPPLAIPVIILSIAKTGVRKVLESRIRTGTQIVQGIYDIDNNIIVSKGNNKAAIRKSKNVKKMFLQYTPVAIIAIKFGIGKNRSYERTLKLIRDNPEYTLYIPDAFKYQALDVNAKRSEIRGQIDAFSLTCQQLIFHLGIIQGKHLDGSASLTAAGFPHPPIIHNINALKDQIDLWSENLQQQIRDQMINPQSGKNSYFTEQQSATIQNLQQNAKMCIEAYQHQVESLDSDAGGQVKVYQFDMDYADKTYAAILAETHALSEVVNLKSDEQSVINADIIKQRLDDRLSSLLNFCKKCSDESKKDKFAGWKKEIEDQISVLDDKISKVPERKLRQIPSQHLEDALTIEKDKINPEINMGLDIKSSGQKQVFMTVKHSRFFENRSAFINRLSEHLTDLDENNDSVEKEKAELVLLPVAKVTSKVLFNFKGSYWKIMWLIRGIDRALESIEVTLNNKDKLGVDINPENIKTLIEFYKQQIEKIEDYRNEGKFSFSAMWHEKVRVNIEQCLERAESLHEKNQPEHVQVDDTNNPKGNS
jgi:hypothetical protein